MIDSQAVGDTGAALLAVLRVVGRSPEYAGTVRAWAAQVLLDAGRDVDAAAWGEAVRHLRGNGILIESTRGQTTWRLGDDPIEMSTEGWPDDGARRVLRASGLERAV
jgi:hypothetical protein